MLEEYLKKQGLDFDQRQIVWGIIFLSIAYALASFLHIDQGLNYL